MTPISVASRRAIPGAATVLAAAITAMPFSALRAQSSSLIGSVTTDSAGKHGIEGAEVTIASLHRSVRTNADGQYLFDGLSLGRYIITVRSMGHKSVSDTVKINVADGTLFNFVLAHEVQPLDPVTTTANKPREYFSPGLNAFEARRMSGFGKFISEAELRQHDNQRLSDILPRLGGLKFVRTNRGTFVTSTHNKANTAGNTNAPRTPPARGFTPTSRQASIPAGCYATVYENRTRIYDMQLTPAELPPNMDDINVDRLAGVEYYAGDDVVPSGYTNSGCGLLILWYREK